MKKNYLILTLTICFVGITSCNQEQEIIPELENLESNAKVETMNRLSHNLGKALAASMKAPEVRAFLKEQALEQFDGDYDIFFAAAKDKTIQTTINGRMESIRFGDVLIGNKGNSRIANNNTLLDSIEAEYPLLQVSIPALEEESAEDWDTSSQEILVAVVNADQDDQTIDFITAYDSQGNEYQLDAHVDPDQIVAVIGMSERVVALEKGTLLNGNNLRVSISDCLSPEPFLVDDVFDYFLTDDVNAFKQCQDGGGGSDGTGGGGSGSTTATCDRDKSANSDKRDNLLKAKFKDKGVLRKAEKWAWGKPEMDVYISYGKFNSNDPLFGVIHKSLGKSGWYHRSWGKLVLDWKGLNREIKKWDKSENGDVMVYSWIEQDNPIFEGSANWDVDVDINFLNTTVGNVSFYGNAKFSIGAQDDHICDTFVYYCDETDGNGRLYNDSMKFYINQVD